MNTNPPQQPADLPEPDHLFAMDEVPHKYGRVVIWVVRLRYLFVFAVMGTFAASVVLLIYGGFEAARMVGAALGIYHSAEGHSLRTMALEIVDTFLVATVLIVLSTGFYQLFIEDDLPLPTWLRIRTPESMELKLLGVIITVLSVSVLVRLTSWDGSSGILAYGIATAAVIAAIAFYLWVHGRNAGRH